MELQWIDMLVFVGFFALVIGVSMFKSRREADSEDYFLAGRGLSWWLIGISIVAANISTEQFVGMAGQGAGDVGLAVSAWQLTGAFGIVIIAFTLLPRFLRAGIYTMPEFLEYRFNPAARGIMAFYTMVIYVTVTITAVLYSGGVTLATIFDIPLAPAVWAIGIIAALYTTWGGLKAVAWADLFQGSALLIGGLITMWLGFRASGGADTFFRENADQLHMILPRDHPTLPWTGVLLGMWIPIVYYCGLNQFIVQRTLAARTLAQGQLGVIFAGALWLIVPFAIVIPGIVARNLYQDDLAAEADKNNAPVVDQFERLTASDTPLSQPIVFQMDPGWIQRHPDRAGAIAKHNARAQAVALGSRTEPEIKNLVGYKYDAAYPILIRRLITPGLRGLMFAAIAGAVISSLASMLNSASTIFTMDLYRRHLHRQASQRTLITIGRIMTVLFVIGGCVLAPYLAHPRFKGVFNFIQEFQGYISPGIVAAFLVGIAVRRAPPAAGATALLISVPIYGLLQWQWGAVHFLLRMAITFGLITAVMLVWTLARPLAQPRVMPVREDMDMRSSPLVMACGLVVMLAVIVFFVIFW
jgi:SSS family solute:Na+ symporter